MLKLILITGFAGATLASVPALVSVSNTRSFAVCCQDSNLLSCSQADVNPAVLGQTSLALPNGITLTFSNMVDGSSTGYYYSGEGGDAVISYNPDTGSMFAHASTNNGDSFVLESCGAEGHIWKQIDVDSLGVDEGVDLEEWENDGVNRELHQDLMRQGTDNTTVVTYSVKFYYTPEFQAVTPDIDGFVDSVVAETNIGYINSQVPIRVSKLCTELATINDEASASTVLKNFKNMKSSVAELRDTADAAALLVNNFGSCGIGYLNVVGSGTTVTATKKSCALGYYSFGHELGHNIGLHHNVEVANNTAYSYGHGHLIAAGTATTGVRSILAYSASGHSQRVHYYSNPDVIYPGTGTPTGIVGVSNNAAVLMKNRFSLANIGDETSASCGSTTVTIATIPTIQTTTPSTVISTTTSPGSCETCTTLMSDTKTTYKLLQMIKKKTMDECKELCSNNPDCVNWNFKKAKKKKGNKCYLYQFLVKRINNWFTEVPFPCSPITIPPPPSCTSTMTRTPGMYKLRTANLASFGTADLSVCEKRCCDESACECWHIRTSDNTCFIGSGCYGDPTGNNIVDGGHKEMNSPITGR